GRAYLFYNDGSIPTTAATADVIITGETTNNYFGISLTSGDFNADGKIDLAVGAYGYSTNTGRAYLFYNDGSIPTTAATADVMVTGETTNNYFGISLTSGDFNADGTTDLAVGAYLYSSSAGRTYIFYNDGSILTTAATADVIITGETTSNFFGFSLTSGDFNADGKTDLAVGAWGYSSSTGRAYIFITEAKAEESVQQMKSKGTFKAKGDFRVK
ncbi:MAG: FG-GAP repeat protein, partial [Candidatus Moranbacteria bacterium]|nr:FG-GAP repeat protein [Candidatus Moranbacteria bacterium]